MVIDNDNIFFLKKYVKMAIRTHAKFSCGFIRQKKQLLYFLLPAPSFSFSVCQLKNVAEGKETGTKKARDAQRLKKCLREPIQTVLHHLQELRISKSMFHIHGNNIKK